MATTTGSRLSLAELTRLPTAELKAMADHHYHRLCKLLSEIPNPDVVGDESKVPSWGSQYLSATEEDLYMNDIVEAIEIQEHVKPSLAERAGVRGGRDDHELDIEFDELGGMIELLEDSREGYEERMRLLKLPIAPQPAGRK